ncbi:unnamed protein product, partial [Brassica oleracea var. botrytis]
GLLGSHRYLGQYKVGVVSPAKKKVTLIGNYCINPSCILQSESVNGTNAGRKSLAE